MRQTVGMHMECMKHMRMDDCIYAITLSSVAIWLESLRCPPPRSFGASMTFLFYAAALFVVLTIVLTWYILILGALWLGAAAACAKSVIVE